MIGQKGEWEEEERRKEEQFGVMRMSPALYADEEGRATMTGDVVADYGPVRLEIERNPSARKEVSQSSAGGRLPALLMLGTKRALLWYLLPDTLMYYASIH